VPITLVRIDRTYNAYWVTASGAEEAQLQAMDGYVDSTAASGSEGIADGSKQWVDQGSNRSLGSQYRISRAAAEAMGVIAPGTP